MAMSTGRSTKRRTLPKQPDVDAGGTWQSPRNSARGQGRTPASYSGRPGAVVDETGDHMSTTETTIRECRHFIGGEWVDPGGARRFDDPDPFTGDVVAHVAAGDRDDARRAIEAAAAAFPEWSQTPPAERQGIFLKAADILESRRDEVVDWLARETGCSFGFGMFQMGFVPGLFRQAAGAAYAPIGEVLPSDMPGAFAMGLRRPVGVVGAIAPWNAALILSARSIAAPLVLGNTVVLKPSEESPYVGGLIWGEIFAEAGLPAGVLNIVTHAPRRGGADRRRARREPARAADQLHGLDRDRAQARRGGGPEPEAGRARARRPEPADRAGRRRPRLRRQRGGLRRVPAPGPDLHVGPEDHRRAADRRRVHRAARREDRGPEARRPEGARHDHRPAHQRAGARDRQGARRRRGRRGARGARRRRGGRDAATRRRCSPTCRPTPSSPGSRRSGRSRPSRSSTAPTRPSSTRTTQRTGSRPASSRAIRTAAWRSPTSSRRGSSTSTTSRSHDEPQMPFGGVKDSGWGRFGGHVRDGRVHRAALGHRAERDAGRSRSDARRGSRWLRSSPLAEAVTELVHDGDTVALEGFTHLIPHAAGHELIRQGRRDLTLVRMTPDVIYDQMIGIGLRARSSSSRGAATRASARCTGSATRSSTAGRRRSRSRSTRTRAWRRPTPPARRTCRSASCAATRAPTSPRTRRRRRGSTARSPARGWPRCRRSGPDVGIVHAQQADRRRQRPALGDQRRPEGGRAGVGAIDRDRRGDRRRARAAVPGAVVLPGWAVDRGRRRARRRAPVLRPRLLRPRQRLLPALGRDQPRPRPRSRHG